METLPFEVEELSLIENKLSFLVRSGIYVKYQPIDDNFINEEAEYILHLNDEQRREYFDRFVKTIFFRQSPNGVG